MEIFPNNFSKTFEGGSKVQTFFLQICIEIVLLEYIVMCRVEYFIYVRTCSICPYL